MTTYENAPATKFVATHCACCGRALVDALSVQTGIGPDCRGMHGFDDVPTSPDFVSARTFIANFGKDIQVETPETMTTTDVRRLCNILIHRFAGNFRTAKWIPDCIYALGYVKLAERLAKRAHVLIHSATTLAATGEVKVTKELYTDSYKGQTNTREVYVVCTPFNPAFNNARVPGRWFDRGIKAWRVPVTNRVPLWDAIRACFKGLPIVTEKGTTVIS